MNKKNINRFKIGTSDSHLPINIDIVISIKIMPVTTSEEPEYEPIEKKFAGTPKEQYLNGPCGNLLRSSYICFQESTSMIKGIDCVDLIKEYHACCREHDAELMAQVEESGGKMPKGKKFACPASISSIESSEPIEDE